MTNETPAELPTRSRFFTVGAARVANLCGLPERVLVRVEEADEYKPGDVVALHVEGLHCTAFVRLRRATRTRLSIETDAGARIYSRRYVSIVGKVVECWRPMEDWNSARDDALEWPEHIGGAS